jgi:hypothetical protein
MHLDEVVDGEKSEREPHRRCCGRSNFENGQSDYADRKDDFQVDVVVVGVFDFAIEHLHEIQTSFLRLISCSASSQQRDNVNCWKRHLAGYLVVLRRLGASCNSFTRRAEQICLVWIVTSTAVYR